MKYIIVEDEHLAAKRLEQLIKQFRSEYELVGTAESLTKAQELLSNQDADLVFLDIQLSDGLSLELFERIEMKAPVIFTTAYDQYAVKAFKVNSVDYLLKPINPSELEAALQKFESSHRSAHVIDSSKLEDLLAGMQQSYKERFVVKIGDHLKFIATSDLSAVYSEEKITFLQTKDGKRYIVDYTVERVNELLDHSQFYRISRKYIVALKCIEDIIQFTNSRLKLKVAGLNTEDVIVARERVQDFKSWLDS
ncbi:MAG: response regulator transcription factor [Cyclobacteriaceae bacterium]